MEKKFSQKGLAVFDGLSVAKNKVVTLKLKLRYDEVVTSINLLKGLNSDITIHAKVDGGKPANLGMFTIGGINFDRDGNAAISFKSMVDNVNMDKICGLVDKEFIQVKFLAVLELPDNGEGGEDDE